MLTAEEIELVKSTKFFGKDAWLSKTGEPCCIARLAISRGVRFYHSLEHGIIVADDYSIVNKSAVELAIWLNYFTKDGLPSPILLCEELATKKRKVFKRATY